MKTTLPKALVRSMLAHFVAPAIPRITLVIFRYAQPVLISTAIRYIDISSDKSAPAGRSIITVAIIVYTGLAVWNVFDLCAFSELSRMSDVQSGVSSQREPSQDYD
jgi:ATP-binding cassette, subfamily C (CFTR/MRP), member 1